MDIDEPVSVYKLRDITTAEIIKNFLQSEGVACHIGGESQAGLTGIIDIDILVHAEDANRARKLLESHESLGEREDDDDSVEGSDDSE